MSDTAKLTYFDARGLAEISRLIMAVTGVEFSEVFLTEREHMVKLLDSGVLPFQQVPLLEIDGLKLAQSGAIARHLARRANIYGSNLEETAKIDMYYEGSRDFLKFFLTIGFTPEQQALEETKAKALPRYLPAFERLLNESGTGFLVGKSMTLADLALLEVLLLVEEYFGLTTLNDYPNLKKFYTSMKEHPKIDAFLKGPQRKKKKTPELIALVKKVLAW